MAAGIQQLHHVLQRLFERVQLVVDRDAQRLKRAARAVAVVLHAHLFGDGRVHARHQIARRLQRDLRDARRPLLLRVIAQNAGDLRRAPRVDDLPRRQRLILIHAHVQRRVRVVGEAALGGVELMAAHAEVDHHTVDFFHAALSQQRLDVVKIALDGGEVARRAEALCRRRQRVVVAVDAVEVPRAVQPTQNLRAVASAAQRAVHIDAALAHVEHIHRGHEHHAHMFKIHRLSLSSLSTVLISPIRYSEPAQTTLPSGPASRRASSSASFTWAKA